ncbi:MAG: hypothetical protein QM734_00685 [Cyclobacteriaceae bacterium]
MKSIDSLTITVARTTNNIFTRYPLDQGVGVKGKFYIGYKQNSYATIGVGFDKNSDSGSKLFYNITGVWQQNTDLQGNAMIDAQFSEKVFLVLNLVLKLRKLTLIQIPIMVRLICLNPFKA